MAIPSKAEYRFATSEDLPALRIACDKLELFARKYEWSIKYDFAIGLSNLISAVTSGKALIVDGYLVCIDVINPWYGKANIVQEWLVLKLYDGGTVDSVPKGLELFARTIGADMIMSADSSPVKIVAGAYEGAAFKPLTTSFYKVLDYGIR
jgi:hypothetical protein